MPDLDYIDDYFNKQLSPEENQRFESRVESDPDFAREVALYYTASQTAADLYVKEKRALHASWYDPAKRRPTTIRTFAPYLAAAALLLFVTMIWFLLTPSSPKVLANRYAQEHFQTLRVSMGSAQDSLQTGLSIYNEGNPAGAKKIFLDLYHRDTATWQPLQYAGIAALQIGNFDEAISLFTALEQKTTLTVNPGYFYHALALILRGRPEDKPAAKHLLQLIIDQNLEEKETAAEMLKGL